MAEKIMLIDGNSIINRAFYGVPLLTNKDGEFTNAVYGFLNIFFKLFDEEKPDYICVCFDLHAPTFRHKLFTEYKGTRKGMPDELRPQMPMLKAVLGAMGVKCFEFEGYEADDLLGTLANYSLKEGLIPVIVSGDRDLLQLASDVVKIKIPKTKGGVTTTEEYYANDVIATYGVTPEEFIEVKALMGDASDNVPGVPSIGEKTAIKIISEYHSVENAIENAADIKPPRAAKNLAEFSEQALLSKRLVTIVTDAPITFNSDEARVKDFFSPDAYELFKKYEFKSLLTRFDKQSFAPQRQALKTRLINSKGEARDFFASLNPWGEYCYCLIYENEKPFCLSISAEGETSTCILLDEDTLIETAKGFFEEDNQKITHCAKKDIVYLSKRGISLNGLVFDAEIAAYVLDANKQSYEFDELAAHLLNEDYHLGFEETLGKGKSKKSLSELGEARLCALACDYSDVILRLKPALEEKMTSLGLISLFSDIEMPLIRVLADMELCGMLINREGLMEYRDELTKKIEALEGDIYWLAGEEFNINSPKQLGYILFEKLGLKGSKKNKTGWSTSADILEKLKDKDEIVGKILEYRSYTKLKTTYADGLLSVISEDGKIHSTFNQTVTSTGRISSTEPNLQNIPIKLELGRRLRQVFIPEKDYIFIDADYSQIELRVLAHLSGDETLINAFINNMDIHRLTASQVFNTDFDKVTSLQRSNAKAVNFGIIYGMGAFSLGQDLSISKKEAEKYIEGYFEKYPMIKDYLNSLVAFAAENGYAKTALGRIRYIPEISSSNFIQRSFGERVAMNMPIQGTAADIIKLAMIRVNKRLKNENLKSRLILQVHDELLIEAHISEAEYIKKLLKEEMENAIKLFVPLLVDVHSGETWYETK